MTETGSVMDRTPILRVRPDYMSDRVLVVGDPQRAEQAAAQLDNSRQEGRFREYVTFTGTHKGKQVAVSSHGVGAPGAAICFEELIRAGARRIIRAGTCGGLQPQVEDGDLVIATAAIRQDGVTHAMVPPAFPASASFSVAADLQRECAARKRKFHQGIVLTHSLFYPGKVLGSDLELWHKAGALAVEMECASLFVLGSLHSVETGAVLVSDGNPLRPNEGEYNPHRQVVRDAVADMIAIAWDALAGTGPR